MQPGEETWTYAWERLHALKKHVRLLRHTMRSIVARNAWDNGESTGCVGSWKVRRTEQGENIQFNFETAPAQSTNTKDSLQADPCWRLELIHRLQARGDRTAGREGGGGDTGSNKEIGGEKSWGDIGRGKKGENEGKTQQPFVCSEGEREFNTNSSTRSILMLY